MDPRVWGCAFWSTIHHVALGYPLGSPSAEQAVAYRSFYAGLGKVLPCGTCSINYERHLAEMPIDGALSGRAALFAWTVALHNTVNREQGKPIWSTERALAHYEAGGGLKGLWPGGCADARRNARILLGVNVALASALLATMVLLLLAWRRGARR
jgi:hypothetical protein